MRRKVALPITGLVSSQWQGPLNPKECFCQSSTLSQYKIMVWECHLAEAVTRAVTTVVANIRQRRYTKNHLPTHKSEKGQRTDVLIPSLISLNFYSFSPFSMLRWFALTKQNLVFTKEGCLLFTLLPPAPSHQSSSVWSLWPEDYSNTLGTTLVALLVPASQLFISL